MKVSMYMSKKQFNNYLLIGISIASIIIVFVSQLLYLNPFTSSWDQVDFTLAVNRFDLMAMQPHFPGYPYFILGGKLVYLFMDNPSEALTMFNILFYGSSLFPIYKLCRAFLNRSFSFLSSAIIYSSSYSIITVNQPMSEGAALAALWWYLWSLFLVIKIKRSTAMFLPLVLLSVMLGIRLSYLPFTVGIIFLYYWKVKNNSMTIRDILIFSFFGLAFQCFWIGALVISEGSILGFVKLSLAFTTGHFNEWGGAVDTSKISFFERLTIFLKDNILWTGIAAKSLLTAFLYFILLITILFRVLDKHMLKRPFINLLFIMFTCYFAWSLLAQNIEKARHALPLVIFLVLFFCVTLFSRRAPLLIVWISVLLLGNQVYKDLILLKAEATERPAVHKMNDYIGKMDESVILYTWEETRVLQYLNVPYTHKRIETYQYFKYDLKYFQGRTVLLTDKVVQGFKSQGISLNGKIKKIATFHSNELFDPVYHDITLYKWIEE